MVAVSSSQFQAAPPGGDERDESDRNSAIYSEPLYSYPAHPTAAPSLLTPGAASTVRIDSATFCDKDLQARTLYFCTHPHMGRTMQMSAFNFNKVS